MQYYMRRREDAHFVRQHARCSSPHCAGSTLVRIAMPVGTANLSDEMLHHCFGVMAGILFRRNVAQWSCYVQCEEQAVSLPSLGTSPHTLRNMNRVQPKGMTEET